jgi:predicted NBD/HSP70 family sugar kinase
MLAIILGTGVGSAMIINGKIHRGGQSRAGEIGFHKHLTPNNEHVNFNDNYSVSGIESLWAKYAQKQQLPENIAQPNTLKSDHPLAIQFLQDIGQKIGTHLSFLIDFIDPDVVVIGGESLAFNEEFQNTIHRTIKQEVIQPPINIVFNCHDEYWTRGAAVLAIDHFFDFENVNGQQ